MIPKHTTNTQPFNIICWIVILNYLQSCITNIMYKPAKIKFKTVYVDKILKF